ncbi:MAG: ComEC/Rec2 family competence protein [Clostridiales Family XIII bacterium]|jgi:competence protein ComEC|nr:ComEC/Rec2 family competence protein [Clostridiales Family XIII bacterium]
MNTADASIPPTRPRRPLAYAAAAYIAGIAFCYCFAPARALLFAGMAAGAVGAASLCLGGGRAQSRCAKTSPLPFHRQPAGPLPFALLLCAVFFAGAAYAHTAFSKADPLEKEMTDGKGYVSGLACRVLSVEQRADDYRLLTVWADGRKLLVRVYGDSGAQTAPAPEELIGRRINLKGALSFPDTARNPNCFDYRLYLLSKGIRVIVTADAPGAAGEGGETGMADAPGGVWRALNLLARAKAAFYERVRTALPPEEAALFAGMMFGDKEAMDEETYELFKRNGAAHILSVSGLHVGMVYAFAAAALGKRKTKRFYAAVLALLLCYAALSNFSPSVMRAVSMIAVHIFSMLANRRYDMLTGVLLSAFIILLFNPLALFGAGFLLSYTAAVSLSFALPFASRFTGFRNRLSGHAVKEGELQTVYGAGVWTLLGGRVLALLVPMAVIQLFMLPVSTYFFNCLPLTAILANIPVIALASLIVPIGIVVLLLSAASAAIPMFAFLFGPASSVGASSAGTLIDLMLYLTRLADRIPGGSLTVPSPPVPLIFLIYGAAFFLLSDGFAMACAKASGFKAYGFALPAAIILACLLAASSPVCGRDDAPYTFVDVGQGDCLHIRTRDGRNYLMDGGGKYDYDVGKNILAPYLLKNGVSRLDGIFVSHLHMDHFKGLTELAGCMDVGAVYVYEGNLVRTEAVTHAFANNTHSAGSGDVAAGAGAADSDGAFPAESIRYLAAGDSVMLGGSARAETLFPQRRTNDEYLSEMTANEDENRTSLIIRFENEGISVLMTGDVGIDGERQALAISDLSCDILKVGHHGSKTSTSEALLAAAQPAAAVIQVGKNNTYGHPTPETLGRLADAGLPVYRCDEDGAVLVRPAPGGFAVQTVMRDLTSPMLLRNR